MKYLVLGDIHSNLEAFKAVLSTAAKLNIDKVVCTGDLIGYGADPSACVRIMRSLPLEAYVGGNHEEKVFSNSATGMNTKARAAIEYTKEQLSDDDRDWMYETAFWKKTFGEKCAVAHGSYYYPDDFAYLGMDEYQRRLCHKAMREDEIEVLFVGHTHTPYFMPKDLKGYPAYTDIDFIDLKKHRPCIIDVGSVGQPRDRDVRASFAVFDTDEDTVIRYRVDYDIEKAAKKISDAGLPAFLAERLREGK